MRAQASIAEARSALGSARRAGSLTSMAISSPMERPSRTLSLARAASSMRRSARWRCSFGVSTLRRTASACRTAVRPNHRENHHLPLHD